MGSAAAYELSKRGVKVLGLEQFEIANARGSSHGESRIVRRSYFEHPDYVPLLERAYRLWGELDSSSPRALYHQSGVLYSGYPHSAVLAGVRKSGSIYNIPLEELTPSRLKDRFPQFSLPADFETVFEPQAGYLEVEECIRRFASLARSRGAALREGERVVSWEAGNGVAVTTDKGKYHAAKLIVTAGVWSTPLLQGINLQVTPQRQVLSWFKASAEFSAARGMPCFLVEGRDAIFYGFTKSSLGVKAAQHGGGTAVADPLQVDRNVSEAEVAPVRNFLKTHLPGVSSELTHTSVCMYEMTPDSHFVIDHHPNYPEITFAAGFSGHGFKFAPVIGEILADLALEGGTERPIEFLRLR